MRIVRTSSNLPLNFLKLWTTGFGLKISNQHEKELKNPDLAYYRYRSLVDEMILRPLDNYVDSAYANLLWQNVYGSTQYLIKQLSKVSFEGLTKTEAEDALIECCHSVTLAQFLIHVHMAKIGPSPLTMLASDDENYALKIAFNWLENSSAWSELNKKLNKEEKDRILRWKKSELPSLEKLNEIVSNQTVPVSAGVQFSSVILHARLIDSLKKSSWGQKLLHGTRLRLLNNDLNEHIEEHVTHVLARNQEFVNLTFDSIQELRSPWKYADNKSYLPRLSALKEQLNNNERGKNLAFYCDWLEANYWSHNGELEKACHLYRRVIKQAIFWAGAKQKTILNEL